MKVFIGSARTGAVDAQDDGLDGRALPQLPQCGAQFPEVQ